MKKVYIWGTGRYSNAVYKTIDKNQCRIVGFIDSNREKQGKQWENCIPILAPQILSIAVYDYIFVSVKDYQPVLQHCFQLKIPVEKVIPFWKSDEKIPYVDGEKKKIVELEEQIETLKKDTERYKWRFENYSYELEKTSTVEIKSSEDLLKEMLDKKTSLCRFGDGELEIVRGKERLWYQTVNQGLSVRLKEILESNEENIMIAIANNFGNLACYTEEAADAIREYLSEGTRAEIMDLLDEQRTYYDAYVSRPYMIYKDKAHAKKVFTLFKKVWNNRRLLIVEGSYTRTGVGNDLFFGADSVRRIICPNTNAFDYYERILKTVLRNIHEGDLVLIALGPTATVLAFDLAKQGIQALDIGQLDNEYEWFLRGAMQRIEIPGKGVSELEWCRSPEDVEEDVIYLSQIIDRI